MSTSLLFDFDPIDQPAAEDPAERLTWCALRIRAGDRFPSTLWDASLQTERKSLYVPAFSIAEWIVQHWWALLNELCRWESVPTMALDDQRWRWLQQHCLRSADSSLTLPALYIYHDGEALRAEWYADPSAGRNGSNSFVSGGAVALDPASTEHALSQFVNDVFTLVDHLEDDRVREAVDRWRAIQGAGAEERRFCELAGRLGLDPYDPDEMPESLASFLESHIADPDDPKTMDFMEIARPETIEQQWLWIAALQDELKLGPNPTEVGIQAPMTLLPPYEYAYQVAQQIRETGQLDSGSPVHDVEAFASSILHRPFRFLHRDDASGIAVQAIVGRSPDDDVIAAGPEPIRFDSRRFLLARSLYHALVTTGESCRLATRAYSWHQRASRAFAAELLAPRAALLERVNGCPPDEQRVAELGQHFEVSSKVIERQFENAGISISFE